MLGGVVRRGVAMAIVMAGFLAGAAGASAAPSEEASFSARTLFPGYDPQVHDYVVRCRNKPVTVDTHASDPWQAAVDDRPFSGNDHRVVVPLRAGRAFTVTIKRAGGQGRSRYYVRCLPSGFPTYTFTRDGPVSPEFFTADDAFAPIGNRYAIIFDSNGVPIWWYHAPVEGPRVLRDGKLLWFRSNGSHSRYEIRRLNGRLVTNLHTVGGAPVDGHDVELLSNGNWLIGARSKQSHVDTRAWGGSANANVGNAELQEVSPRGKLLWDWKSQDHVSLAETGRWWPDTILNPVTFGYDVAHWNSIEPRGNAVIASFKRLDAVYKISKSTGSIVWKLGGTPTPRSLMVQGDPYQYPLGGQHDARRLSDGTLSVFDNRTGLVDPRPRAVRYRIDQNAGTAALLESISDPEIPISYCCGSARRLPNQDWLIGWGQQTPGGSPAGAIAGYKPDGERTFLLRFNSTFSYRAQPVPPRTLTREALRKAMTAICSSGC